MAEPNLTLSNRRMPVIYSRPVLGPRTYVAKSNSGWTDSFPKKDADKAIREFLAPLEPSKVAENFVAGFRLVIREAQYRQVLWEDIVDYLAGIKACSKSLITGLIGIGFWAAVLGLIDVDERGFN